MGHTHNHIHGEHWPSVTQILSSQPKPWLDRWYEKHGSKATNKTRLANLVGTEFHRCAELAVKGEEWSTPCPRVRNMMKSLLLWPDFKNVRPVVSELKVWSDEHKYQGTLDLIAKIGRKLVIIDWKSGSGIYDDMQLQLAAYAHCYCELFKAKIKEGLIVLVSKDKPFHKLTVKKFSLTKRALNKFLKLRMKFPEVMDCDGADVTDLP